MYIPTEDPLATQIYNNPTNTASAVARQIITSTGTSTDSANPANNPQVIIGDAWFDAPWVTPACWALAFYCVLSLLLLCTLYGQGVVDGKLNYIRQRRHVANSVAMLPAHESDQGPERLQRTQRGMRESQDHVLASQYLPSSPSISYVHHENAGVEHDSAEHLHSDSRQNLSNALEDVRLERALRAAGLV